MRKWLLGIFRDPIVEILLKNSQLTKTQLETLLIDLLAEKISGKKIKIEYDLKGPRGTYKYCPDTAKMKKVLGWAPSTPLDEGLKRTYKWAEEELFSFYRSG